MPRYLTAPSRFLVIISTVVAALVLLGVAALLLFRRHDRPVLFWALWFPVCLSVTTFAVVLYQLVNDESGSTRYRELVAYRLGRSLAHDRCLAHLAVLRGERPTRIVVEQEKTNVWFGTLAYLLDYLRFEQIETATRKQRFEAALAEVVALLVVDAPRFARFQRTVCVEDLEIDAHV